MEMVSECGWRCPIVVEASTFAERWRGLRPASNGRSLLLRASSVHGFGMHHRLEVVALDTELTVIGIAVLLPHRVVRVRGAVWILELPPGHDLPSIGSRLRRRR